PFEPALQPTLPNSAPPREMTATAHTLKNSRLIMLLSLPQRSCSRAAARHAVASRRGRPCAPMQELDASITSLPARFHRAASRAGRLEKPREAERSPAPATLRRCSALS